MTYRNLFDLSGRVAVVVGAASGIGREAALGLAAFGALTVCADLNTAGAERVASAICDEGGRGEAAAVDVSSTSSVRAMVAGVKRAHGRLDVLVATPGINVRKALLRYADEEFDRVVEINLKGTFRLLREAAQAMVAQGSGSLIVLSSIRSVVVEPGQGVYAATKAGMVQLVRALAAEVGPKGVRVNAVAPGVVDTPLTAPIKAHPDWYGAYAAKTALGRWARAEEMVGPVIFLASDAGSYVTGTVLFADGGWTAIDGRFDPPL